MTPLDLRSRPPRDPREQLAGLLMLPRTLDKARALLPGGHAGEYFITPGLSAWLLGKLHIGEAEFVEIVRLANDEADVAAAIEARTDVERRERLNATLRTLRVAQISGDIRELFFTLYGPDLDPDALVIDILTDDDRAAFAGAGRL